MSVEQKRFHDMLSPSIESVGCELLGVQLSKGRQHTLLRLYIDRLQKDQSQDGQSDKADAGITVDDCARVSRQVSGVLDVEDPIQGEYSLEVSSPGDDRPLFFIEHYERFIGHVVRVRLSMPIDGQRNIVGRIAAVEDGHIVIDDSSLDTGQQWRLAMEQIALGRLVPQV